MQLNALNDVSKLSSSELHSIPEESILDDSFNDEVRIALAVFRRDQQLIDKVLATVFAKKDGPLYNYSYMVTFTIDPNKHKEITKSLVSQIEDYIEGIPVRFKKNPVLKLFYVVETHENGRPHWHMFIATQNYLKKDVFKTFTKKFGYIDFKKNTSKTSKHAEQYMQKQNIPKYIL